MKTTGSAALSVVEARRLALLRAGLLHPGHTGLPQSAGRTEAHARKAAWSVINRFGYLQLDTVCVAGARSHAIVLHSRLDRFDPATAERLLVPGAPLFEYWGHEVSWMPIELYPVFDFRRKAFRHHPWWGDLVGRHPKIAADLLRKIREDGPLRSREMEGRGGRGWWDLKITKKVATALWSSGELAIRERQGFQRTFDLTERVIPERWMRDPLPEKEAIERLLLLALEGHGWAATGTLTQTWRLRNRGKQIREALGRLVESGRVVPCDLVGSAAGTEVKASKGGRAVPGWIRPEDLETAARLKRIRPRRDQGVLLSPFDPILWDRARVQRLFGFDQVLEIFKRAPQRIYGYYCLPVLAGERLIARFDLKADARSGTLQVVAAHFEDGAGRPTAVAGASRAAGKRGTVEDREAARTALERYAGSLGLRPVGWKA